MQKITPFLWFNDKAEEAVKFYTSIFKNSRIKTVARYDDAGPGPKGSVMTVSPARRSGVRRAERRTGVQLHSGTILCRELPHAG